jgi:hypothetical protein
MYFPGKQKNNATIEKRRLSVFKIAFMKNKLSRAIKWQIPIWFLLFVTGCVKDKMTITYTLLKPVYKDRELVLANMKLNQPQPLRTTGKIYVYGQYIFLNELNKGVHVIDNSNPKNPEQIGFIDIPGNVDIAVKGNILLADFYTDLVAIDISNPAQSKLVKVVPNVFQVNSFGIWNSASSSQVVVDWIRKDTTVADIPDNRMTLNCPNCSMAALGGDTRPTAVSIPGMGGSMARFTIVGDYLYAVDRHFLRTISIQNAAAPEMVSEQNAGWDIETIYPMEDHLFLGSMTGLFIFNIAYPANPVPEGQFIHARGCDPVIAEGDYAFVTLRQGTNCGPTKDELLVINISDFFNPALVQTYDMHNPHGLSKSGNLLFVCDGNEGVKIYDATTPTDLKYVRSLKGMNTYDIITYNALALVVAEDGLYQFDYSNPADIKLLSKLAIDKKLFP